MSQSGANWNLVLSSRTYCHLPDDDDDGQQVLYAAERLQHAYRAVDLEGSPISIKTAPPTGQDIRGALRSNMTLVELVAGYLTEGRYDTAITYFHNHWLQKSDEPTTASPENDVSMNLFTHWSDSFYGRAIDALSELIESNEASASIDAAHYSKYIPIIQSSGMGKSRLAAEVSRVVFSITFTFRPKDARGYPSGDYEILEYLLESTKALSSIERHTLIGALLAGALDFTNEWIQIKSRDSIAPEGLVKEWYNEMQPVRGSKDTRSKLRRIFCEEVVKRAKEIYAILVKDVTWQATVKQRFSPIYTSDIVRKYFLIPTESLIAALPATTKSPIMFWVFDEAVNIDKPGGLDDSANFIALRRVLLLFSKYSIWSMFLSTNSKVGRFAAGQQADTSDRVTAGELRLFPPFFSFPVDVEWKRRMEDPGLRSIEFAKPMVEFESVDHMTVYGRPLWRVYTNQSASQLSDFARYKLLCGSFALTNVRQSFALLANRLALDIIMNSPEAATLAKESVNCHLRLLVGWSYETGAISTTTPSEPVVADAAIAALMLQSLGGELVWTHCIRTLANELLARGLVAKGVRGELYARLVLVVARDMVKRPTELEANYFQNSRAFKLGEFLQALVGDSQFDQITQHQFFKNEDRPRRGGSTIPVQPYLMETFKNARLNFSHFTFTNRKLPQEPKEIASLLSNMLRQHQALQLSEYQKYWDLLIPMYLGPPEQDFSMSWVSAILIQVKNRKTRSQLSAKPHEIREIFGNTQPLLQILLDLGMDSNKSYEFRGQKNPDVYSIHIRGSGAEAFACLNHLGMSEAARPLIGEGEPLAYGGDSIRQEIDEENIGIRWPREECE